MTTLWGDLETYSDVPISNGTYAYAASAEIMLFAWAIDEGAVNVWDLTADEPMPEVLFSALADESVLINFHNVQFDRTVLRLALNSTPLMRRAGDQIYRWRDTMVKALAHSMPSALGKLSTILKLGEKHGKAQNGRRLVLLFCKPLSAKSAERRATAKTHPVDWINFKDYARLDVLAMREADRRLPAWNYPNAELNIWHLDQKINDRGVCLDVGFVHAAIAAVDEAKAKLDVQTRALTSSEVGSATQRDRLIANILETYGVKLPDMKASTLERLLEDETLPVDLRELLNVRLQTAMGSVSKYKAMLNAVSADGRARGLLQFDGAGRTGRWAGRTIQPQNMMRPPKYIKERWDFTIDAIKSGACELFFDNVTEAVASTVRGAIISAPGHKLVVADLANIEGRVQAWLAGEEWKLQAFRDFDAGQGHDLYKLAYARSFGVDTASVTPEQRQIGKVQELMLGYGGGVGAFVTGALGYGFDLEQLGATAWDSIPEDAIEEAQKFYGWMLDSDRNTFGLSERAFVVCDSLKRLWRRAHPAISSLWKEMEEAAVQAVRKPGTAVIRERFSTLCKGSWLRVRLPSGRALVYPSPQVDDKGSLSYMGIDQYTRKWARIPTYGGKLFENACQALGCHVLKDNMSAIEAAGYPIVLTVHDEVLTEPLDEKAYSADELCRLLATNPVWCPNLPLAAAGFETYRYRKD